MEEAIQHIDEKSLEKPIEKSAQKLGVSTRK